MKKIFVVLLIISASVSFGQGNDAADIIKNVREVYSKVQDYKVDAEIIVKLNFLSVPNSNAVIFYKQPDKIKINSEGFALFPKEGLSFTPGGFLDENISPIYVKEDTLENNIVDVIKVVPLSDSAKFILSTLWVDREEHVIRQVETTTKNNGTMKIELDYDNKTSYGLPSEVTFRFNVKEFSIPGGMGRKLNTGGETPNEDKRGKGISGEVIVKYSDYEVNSGLPDELFEDDGQGE